MMHYLLGVLAILLILGTILRLIVALITGA